MNRTRIFLSRATHLHFAELCAEGAKHPVLLVPMESDLATSFKYPSPSPTKTNKQTNKSMPSEMRLKQVSILFHFLVFLSHILSRSCHLRQQKVLGKNIDWPDLKKLYNVKLQVYHHLNENPLFFLFTHSSWNILFRKGSWISRK